MSAAVLSIGTELTRGELVNTNATWLAERLTEAGFEVTEHLVIDDDEARIVSALGALGARHRVVVSTGGLGPTTDDLTSAAVARALGVPLERHQASLDAIRRRFASFGREMSPTNEKQADFPRGATVLPNPVGTAPGFAVDLAGGARAFFLPGVPSEMRRLYEDHIAREIAPLAPRTMHQIRLRSFGLPESVVGEKLAGLEAEHPGVVLGYRAHFPEIEVKVRAIAATHAAAAEALATQVAAKVKERLGDVIWGEGDDSYAAYVGRTLRDRGLTLALAESCTGGLVGQLVTAVPGSSDYLLLDAVTYSNTAKTRVLGVQEELMRAYGAVSREVVIAMAEGALRISDADLAVSITGIAGPGGGTDAKPVGTVWMAIAQRGRETVSHHHQLRGDRERIRVLAAWLALQLVARAAGDRG